MNQQQSPITLPAALIISSTIIAVAIMWVKKPVSIPVVNSAQSSQGQQAQLAEVSMAPVTADDHILGNPNAPIKIVEYSDPSCPFCKMFHAVMVQVMNQYGAGGKVAWVYRSFPLDKKGTTPDGGVLHPNAGHEAQAFECAAAIGGNTKFWAFAKHFYETTPSVTPDSPQGLDQSTIPQLAKDVGIDQVAFNDCLSSNRFKDKVEAQYLDGLNAGVNGTPYSIIITPTGSKIPLVGSQTFSTMKSTIEALLPSASK